MTTIARKQHTSTDRATAKQRAEATPTGSLLTALATGRSTAALTFAGNGTPWLAELRAILADCPAAWPLVQAGAAALTELTSQQAFTWSGLCAQGVDLLGWVRGTTPEPTAAYLASSQISQPCILLTQVARYVQILHAHSIDVGDGPRPTLAVAIERGSIVAATGHSQGVMIAMLVSEAGRNGGHIDPARCAQYVRYMTWQGLLMGLAWRQAGVAPSDRSPMAAIAGPTHAELGPIVDAVAEHAPVSMSIRMSHTRHVVSGAPDALEQLQNALQARKTSELALRKQGRHGGPLFDFTWDDLPVEAAYHSEFMRCQLDAMRHAIAQEGFAFDQSLLAFDVLDTCTAENLRESADPADRLLQMQYVQPVNWTDVIAAVVAREPDAVIDFGPGPGVARVTASILRGRGIHTIALAEPSGRRALLQTPLAELDAPVRYADFAPGLVRLGTGKAARVAIDNRYTRATGQSPIILPGMTPTTVDVPIVAAAANAGFTAELAGGGQVNEAIFSARMDELAEALQPGVEVTFNALYMDRYLWNLHFGEHKLVQKARKSGAPIAGVTISAGIPDVDEAVALLDGFASVGMRLNAFKPGTAAQVDRVLAIADAAPQHDVFVHLEGGKAGGHHSWEDLDALLLATYAKMRARANVIICVGGGIADEARSVALLTGRWAAAHGMVPMPVDAVFLGTAAMACKEATASPAVKRALADAQGTDDWVHSGAVFGGVTSGKSQLDADIHYLENAAARCGRLLDSVAGDAAAISARRDEIIAALASTAKPYFGDLDTMTWQQVLVRMIELLAVGQGTRYEDGIWPDRSHRERVADMIRRAEGRLSDAEAPSVLQDLSELDEPLVVLDRLVTRYPAAATITPHPTDERYFVQQVCARPGKPVSFVPIIDADVRRWFKSDSLWQAQDPRFDADKVLIIPGPQAIRGIHSADEPVAELLGRFERALVTDLQDAGEQPNTRAWLAVGRPAKLPAGVRIERGEGVATWRVAGADVAADAWFAPLGQRYSGTLAQAFAAETVFVDSAPARNPLRRLCPADAGASLWIEPVQGSAHTVTWRSATAQNEAVRLRGLPDGTIELSIELPAAGDVSASPWLQTLSVDSNGKVHLAAATGADVRDFYNRNLFGQTLDPVALFDAATDTVSADPQSVLGYSALSRYTAAGLPPSMAFSLVFRAMMRTLSCDELAPGLLSLVHLEHAVQDGPCGPIEVGEELAVAARVTKLRHDADGLHVQATATITSDKGLCATVHGGFMLRGYTAPCGDCSDENVAAAIEVTDEAAVRFLVGHGWLKFAGDVHPSTRLIVNARATTTTRDGALQHTATGGIHKVVRSRTNAPTPSVTSPSPTIVSSLTNAPIGKITLASTGAPTHPLTALVATLAPADGRVTTPLSVLAEVADRAPLEVASWAECSLDRNPIHRSLGIARLAGLDRPIVHGMWSAARARAFTVDKVCGGDPTRLRRFDVRFVAPLQLGEPIALRATRIAMHDGAVIATVTLMANRQPAGAGAAVEVPVLTAEATIAPPRVAYIFPGQGIQQTGMGMQGYARSRAAREIWDTADAFCRANLGFSVLHVVRDNPKELLCKGRRDVHEKGVLNLTQYTQVAMAILAQAQVAELREAGAFVADAAVAGHSVGEYTALSAAADVLSLRTVVEAVWRRGLAMHECVPRDADGKSGYAMGVIRPHYAGLSHEQASELVALVAQETGGFVEIVNYNVRDRQYSTVGDSAALDELGKRLAALQRPGGKAPWLLVVGIDVPFHSTRLRDGVGEFRVTLDRLMPQTGFSALVNRYVPNLVGLPFRLDRPFIDAMVAATNADEVRAFAADFERWSQDPDAFARALVIELLAFQFASPVRWIGCQESIVRPLDQGGLGAERVIEIGVGYQPTVANMAKQTFAAMPWVKATVLNIEADAAVVLHRDEVAATLVPGTFAGAPVPAPAADIAADIAAENVADTAAAPVADTAADTAAAPVAAPVSAPAAAATSAPTDRQVTHLDALRTLLALQARVRVDQIRSGETIDELFGGVSSRRNQVLVDLGVEFDAGAIDGAHELPIEALGAALADRAGGWKCPGGYLTRAWDDAIRRVFGRVGQGRSDVIAALKERFGLGDGLCAAALNTLCLAERAGDSTRGGALGTLADKHPTSTAGINPLLDALTAELGQQLAVTIAPLAAAGGAGGGAAVDAAVVADLERRILGPDGALMHGVRDAAERLGVRIDGGSDEVDAKQAADALELDTLRDRDQLLAAEHGAEWLDRIAPVFAAERHVAFTSPWAWARRDLAALFHGVRNGELSGQKAASFGYRLALHANDANSPKTVAHTARWFAGQAHNEGDSELAKLLTSIADGTCAPPPPLTPTRPTLTVDNDGALRFAEQPDESDGAMTALLRSLLGSLLGSVPDGEEAGRKVPNKTKRTANARAHIRAGNAEDDARWRKVLATASTTPLAFAGRTALVTGASPGSIAVEVVRHLLLGGARVIVTTSSPRRERLLWYRRLYQQHAGPGAELHIVPFNQASSGDVQALIDWLFERVTEPDGARVRELKPAFAPDIVVPFAALGDTATLDRLDGRSEVAVRTMLLGVEKLVAGIGARYRDNGAPERPVHVLLPLSPNHGSFGGDGAYAETKAGLEALCNKWHSEQDAWAASIGLCAARIGWVRGTGLMDANDTVAAALEERTGARTFSSAEMGWLLASLCADEMTAIAANGPLDADLTGGFGDIADIRSVVGSIRADHADKTRSQRRLQELVAQEQDRLGESTKAANSDDTVASTNVAYTVKPLPAWPAVWPVADDVSWPKVTARPADTVVIVGAGELGPCGTARTRWALEVDDELSAAAVLELAWMCGLVAWQDNPRGGTWIDVATESAVAEADIADRYRAAVRQATGIRWTEPENIGFDPEALPVLATAWLDRDFTFEVGTEAEARSFVAADPDHTRITFSSGRWRVTRVAGAEVRVPRVAKLTRKVLGALPAGLSMARFGIAGDMIESIDRVALMNLVATADAFLGAGMTPQELLAHVHPARVANTQGSGLGGMRSLQRLYTDLLLDRERQADTVQETLINVVAAYTVQSYLGSYGPMVHPVGACATAAVSLEEGMDKILAGRADFSVTGGFDDVGGDGMQGFQDMQATADSELMTAMGFEPDQMSRANDLRRRGFVEAQGGGTLLLCRGDVARDMGLPVRGVLAWAGSFSDGVHTSIPAPGLGVVAAAMGGKKSPLGQALTKFGLQANDIAVVYKHDTSTAANDPNENAIHTHVQRALGRSAGNPLFVVSQKTLTGHAKGGAAAFQAIGLCQALADGRIPGNRNLDCVDPAMQRFDTMAFTDTTINTSQPMRAGMLTSLGFGHVGAVALVLHPAAFTAMLKPAEKRAHSEHAQRRERAALRRHVDVLMGKTPLFERRAERPFNNEDDEVAMLLDPDARIGGVGGVGGEAL